MNHEKYSKLIIYSWRSETFDPNSFAQVANATMDFFKFRLVMPGDAFAEKEFLLMKAICDVQDLECVREPDDTDI